MTPYPTIAAAAAGQCDHCGASVKPATSWHVFRVPGGWIALCAAHASDPVLYERYRAAQPPREPKAMGRADWTRRRTF